MLKDTCMMSAPVIMIGGKSILHNLMIIITIMITTMMISINLFIFLFFCYSYYISSCAIYNINEKSLKKCCFQSNLHNKYNKPPVINMVLTFFKKVQYLCT